MQEITSYVSLNPVTGLMIFKPYVQMPGATFTSGSGNITLSGRYTNSVAGAASAPPESLTGTWFTGGTSTTTKPQFLIEPSGTTSNNWSTSGTGIGINAVSGFVGNLLDLQINALSIVKLAYAGNQWQLQSSAAVVATAAGVQFDNIVPRGIRLNSDVPLGWSNSVSTANGGQDTQLWRDSANIIAQRVGTNPQTFRLYNTYTDASNYERYSNSWSSNVLNITNEAAGTGTLRSIAFSQNAAASTPPVSFTGTWFTGGNSTTTKPQFLIEPSGTTSTAWSTAGTGLGINAASGFTGNLLDLQVNASSVFRVSSTGIQIGGRQITTAGGGNALYLNSLTYIEGSLTISGSGNLTFAINTSGGSSVTLAREGANILSLQTGNNPQTFRIYNAYTDASNYERLSIDWTSNVCYARPQNAGTGAARIFVPVTGSTTVASLPTAATAGAGARAFVTDATATTFLSTVAGGGANKVPVVSDGTNWLIG